MRFLYARYNRLHAGRKCKVMTVHEATSVVAGNPTGLTSKCKLPLCDPLQDA